MPLEKLAFFLGEIGPLQAQESLRRVNELRLARAGKDDKQAQMSLIGWENEANRIGQVDPEDEPKMTKGEYFAMIGRMGIKQV